MMAGQGASDGVTLLYEDNHIVVISKPHGMPSQPDPTGDFSALDWVREYIRVQKAKPGDVYVGLVHRLDRPTAGIMVFARTSKAAARLSEQFRGRDVKKVYHAITEQIPQPETGILEHYLKKPDPSRNIVRAYDKPTPGADFAQLQYRTIITRGNRALLEVIPLTGRQHQIRVQLSRIGCTIAGDVKYGNTDFLPGASIALIAKEITFSHPVQHVPVTFSAPYSEITIWDIFPKYVS